MGQCVDKLPHKCGSRNGLQVFEDDDGGHNGYCFSCKTYVPDPYEGGVAKPKKAWKKSPEEIAEEIEFISSLGSVDLVDRKLRKAGLDYFGIKIGLSEEDGKTVAFHHYPYKKDGELKAYKTRLVEQKKMWSVGDQSDVDLFGWDQATSRGVKRLIIVEGELDAVALHRIFDLYSKDGYRDSQPSVCSLPHGASAAARDLAKLASKIRKHFKEITLCFDDDEPGRKAMEDCCKILPEATVATLPEKDANDCLKKGSGKAAMNAIVFNHKKPKNSRLVWGEQLHDKAKEPPKWGFDWPWEQLTEITRGMRFGETVYVGAAQKMGKSEIVNALIAWCISNHGWKVFAAKPEEANEKTYKMVAGKVVGKLFHDPKAEFDEGAFDRAGAVIKDKLAVVNIYQHLGWDTLKGDIIAAAAEGCRAIFIDPVTCLVNGMSAADANTKLQEIAQDAAAMALDLDVIIFISCHLRNPESGTPHERGGKVLSNQFAGSRAMARSCNLMMGLEGNRDPDLPLQERNMRNLVVLENRETGDTGNIGLYYDQRTGLFNEVH